jgi:hypothetical protein
MSTNPGIHSLAPAKPIEVRAVPAAPDAPGGLPTPFFFGAARRSGTTWLAGMLNAHPQIECRNEGWMFNDFGASFPDWLDEAKVRCWAERREARGTWLRHQSIDEVLRDMRRALWLAVTRRAIEREGWKDWSKLRFVGDKTTTHFCAQADEIRRIFPDARFLHMLRDGRDAVVSDAFLLFRELDTRDLPADARDEALASRQYRFFGTGKPLPLFGPALLRHLASDWAVAASGGRRARELFGPNWREVRYERLVERPVDELRAVIEWLGTDADPAFLEHTVRANAFEKHSGGRAPGQEDPAAEWRKGVGGDWRNHFTNDDKALFKSIAGELLIELGYEKNTSW